MEPIIQVEHLCKSFSARGGSVEAAKDICFCIEKGDIFGIIGLSGAGKSTLVLSESSGAADFRYSPRSWKGTDGAVGERTAQGETKDRNDLPAF